VFRVTYSNGNTYTRSLDFLLNAPEVWWNPNDAGFQVNHLFNASPEWWHAKPFRVQGLIRGNLDTGATAPTWRRPGGWGVNGAGAQEISFYYRGYTINQPVVVWNRLNNITVVSADGNAINMDMRTGQDNDNISGLPGTAAAFAEMIIVTAYYSELRDPTNTTSIVLRYDHALAHHVRRTTADLLITGIGMVQDTTTPYSGRPSMQDFSNIGQLTTTNTGLRGAANLGRVYSMDFGMATSTDRVTGAPVDAWGQAFRADNAGTFNHVNIWYAAPWITHTAPIGAFNHHWDRAPGFTVGSWLPSTDATEVPDEWLPAPDFIFPTTPGPIASWQAMLGIPQTGTIAVGWTGNSGF
jgi:hypothetical protein